MGKLTIEELRAVRRRNNLTISIPINKEAPEIRSEEIATQVAEFIARGGKIKEIDSKFNRGHYLVSCSDHQPIPAAYSDRDFREAN